MLRKGTKRLILAIKLINKVDHNFIIRIKNYLKEPMSTRKYIRDSAKRILKELDYNLYESTIEK